MDEMPDLKEGECIEKNGKVLCNIDGEFKTLTLKD